MNLKFVYFFDVLYMRFFLCSKINDPINKYVVLDAITFPSDKEECRKILDQVSNVTDCTDRMHWGGGLKSIIYVYENSILY